VVLTVDPGTAPAAIQWTLNYPTTAVARIAAVAGPAASAANKTLTCAAFRCVLWGINTQTIQSGVVAVLTLELAKDASGGVAFQLTGALAASLLADPILINTANGLLTVAKTPPVFPPDIVEPTNGAVYWSTTQPDCSSLAEDPIPITNQLGVTIGYSCYVAGTFPWLAAGGQWSTTIRVAAPVSAPIGVDYTFYDTNGNPLSMNTTGLYAASSNDVNFALYANQPAEIDLLGATSTAPSYSSITMGSAYAVFFCPDALTCSNVLPQLNYSALPSEPWALSGPIVWDVTLNYWSSTAWTQFCGEGIDDGGMRRVSLVIYNDDLTAMAPTVSVFDSAGTLVGQATTPSIPPLQYGGTGEGGAYGALLSSIIPTPLPSGVFKVLVDSGSLYSEVEMIQFNGTSATTMQLAFDTSPTSSPASTLSAAAVQRSYLRRLRVTSMPKAVFRGLPR